MTKATLTISALVDILEEEGGNSIEILLILVWVCPDSDDGGGQLVTPNAIKQVLNFRSWIKVLVPIFHEVSQDNMVLDMAGNIIIPVLFFLLFVIH